jgi:hypothetical protein
VSSLLLLSAWNAPVWISSGLKKINNKRAMEMTQRNTDLSFCTTHDGIGLVLKF